MSSGPFCGSLSGLLALSVLGREKSRRFVPTSRVCQDELHNRVDSWQLYSSVLLNPAPLPLPGEAALLLRLVRVDAEVSGLPRARGVLSRARVDPCIWPLCLVISSRCTNRQTLLFPTSNSSMSLLRSVTVSLRPARRLSSGRTRWQVHAPCPPGAP